MARRKYNPNKYKKSNPGDPLTEEWTVRSAIIAGKRRDVLIRKVDGKKHRRFIVDERMSPNISYSEAKKFHDSRKPRAKAMDKSQQHSKVIKNPTKAWKNRPGRSDVKSIDTKTKRKK
ncbi:MAG: hypothetical protein GY853_15845 [PVC group bacterium]|nr:hypothetical protein [PVC group bacterium]